MPDAAPNASAHSYEVLGKLAEGGMTEIFLARAKGPGAVERFVVLKRLKRAVTSHVDLVKLFLDEARLASQLQHPNVAQVFEVGKLGGSYFFAMEFVNGETLQSLMLHARSRKIQVPVRAVLTIAAAVAAGLHHAHDRKGTDGQPLHIVHGEVSPLNVLVSQEGIVKLVDFGVAKAGEHGGGPRISPYASPEQCMGAALDRRSDLFSLGIVLWELLTLDGLYHRANDNDISLAISTEAPIKPSAKRYDVPPELDEVVLRLLAKDPAERFQDADELLAAIEALAQKLSILLSTADLSRMMRLWFGTKSEPTVDPAEAEATPLVVSSEDIPDDLAIPVESPIDHQLEHVRDAAALIITRATERSRNTTGRPDQAPTVPPELMDNPNENFEQIRDRILARARQKKETMRNQIGVVAIARVPASEARIGSDPERHTRATAPAPLASLEPTVRPKPATNPPDAGAGRNGSNGRVSGEPRDTADAGNKLVIDSEQAGSRVVSGELTGGTGTDKAATFHAAPRSEPQHAAAAEDDDDRGSTVVDLPPREAPPAVGNVATPAAAMARDGDAARAAGEDHDKQGVAAPDAARGAELSAARDGHVAAGSAEANGAPEAEAHAAREAEAHAAREAEAHAAREAEAHAAREAEAKAAREAEAHAAREAEAKAAREAEEKAAREAEAKARESQRQLRLAERDEKVAAADRAARATREAARAATDVDRERAESIATARASTAEILRRPARRPLWILPSVAAAALLLAVFAIAKLGGSADKQPTKPSGSTSSATGTNAVARPATTGHANHTSPAGHTSHTGTAASGTTAGPGAATNTGAANPATMVGTTTVEGGTTTSATTTNGSKTGDSTMDGSNLDGSEPDTTGHEASTTTVTTGKQTTTGKKDTTETRQTSAAKKDKAEPRPTTKDPEANRGIEELFAAGEFAKTNTACTKEIVFTPQKLEMCAQAACETSNTALAKRWINAISKASRPPLVDKCKSLGVDLEAAASADTPPASSP